MRCFISRLIANLICWNSILHSIWCYSLTGSMKIPGSIDIKSFFQAKPNKDRTNTNRVMGTANNDASLNSNYTLKEECDSHEIGTNTGISKLTVNRTPKRDILKDSEVNLSWSEDELSVSCSNSNLERDIPSENSLHEVNVPAKKQKTVNIRRSEADEPSVGSLFNISLKENDKNADIMSAKFDPSLFDISHYKSTFPPQGNRDSLLFNFLAEILQKVEDAFGSGTGSRKYVFTLLSNFFRVLIYHQPSDVIPAMYLMLNRISAEYEGEEFGVGDTMLIKAMAQSYGKSEKAVKEMLSKHEDLGKVASLSSCTSQTIVRLPDLTITSVFNNFKTIAREEGKNSMTRKTDIIKRMLSCAKKIEAKYIVRCLQQKMRIGVNAPTLFQSIADATYLTKASKDGQPAIGDIRTSGIEQVDSINDMEKAVKTATTYLPCIETVVGHLLDGDTCDEFLEHCKIRPGIPVRPMLAKAISKTSDIVQAIGAEDNPFTCEYKYDGERLQIHLLEDRCVKLFSRNMENLCGKYPDVMENFLTCVKPDVQDCIIDSEVVAYDRSSGKILPFQQLSTRKRKGVTVNDVTIQVCIYPFDILYLNGEQIVDKSLKERRKALESTVYEKDGLLHFARHKDMDSLEDIDDFLRQAVSDSCEGLMIKSLDSESTYEPQKRSNNWLKFKKDYIDGMGDSVDLVPIAAFLGKGKRTSVYGSYLLAVYDPIHEVYQSVCKTGTGFSDQTLKDLFDSLQEHTVQNKPSIYVVSDKFEPDVWFQPAKVWECKAADLSISPIHTASQDMTASGKGIGLRFPRFVRLREDKKPMDATTSHQIFDMYESQFKNGAS